jgi:hypothetical protein
MWGRVIQHVGQHRNPDMKPRHFLARIVAVVTAAAAIGMFLGPARADAADHQPAELDGWANPDLDVGALSGSLAEELGSRVDGWGNRDLDVGALSGSLAEELGSRVDGWATGTSTSVR